MSGPKAVERQDSLKHVPCPDSSYASMRTHNVDFPSSEGKLFWTNNSLSSLAPKFEGIIDFFFFNRKGLKVNYLWILSERKWHSKIPEQEDRWLKWDLMCLLDPWRHIGQTFLLTRRAANGSQSKNICYAWKTHLQMRKKKCYNFNISRQKHLLRTLITVKGQFTQCLVRPGKTKLHGSHFFF